MKTLAEASKNIAATASTTTKNSQICSDGLGTKAGTEITKFQPPRRPTADEIPDILSKVRSIRPWQTRPDDHLARSAAKNLSWTTIPATYDEATYWIARALAHFPRRDATKDAIIISDLAGEISHHGYSLLAVAGVLEMIWKSATEEKPWWPVTGQILQDIAAKSAMYERMRDQLARNQIALPAPQKQEPKPMFDGRKWPDLSEGEREVVHGLLDTTGWETTAGMTLRKIMGVPEGYERPKKEIDLGLPLPQETAGDGCVDFFADKDSEEISSTSTTLPEQNRGI